MSLADRLTEGGLQGAVDIVGVAAQVGIDLAIAAVLVEKESGGRNVWGSDPVPTGGAYMKGGPVTEANYRAYRQALSSGRAGPQGVGPCQLTWHGYQDEADRMGGCWEPRANLFVGFRALRDLQKANGIRDGFRRYNGSGPAAERYAADAMARLDKWRARLAPTEEDDMPSIDQVRMVVREELDRVLDARVLPVMATRKDVGYARDQTLTALGVDGKLDDAPTKGAVSPLGVLLQQLLTLLRKPTA